MPATTRDAPRVLIVGAGAVGQVYGYHLQRGGARVSLLVRPHHADTVARGFDLYPLNRRHPRRRPARFDEFAIVTAPGDPTCAVHDVVVLCVSSTALRRGTWLDDLLAATGDATVVVLQPGIDDVELVCARAGDHRVVRGVIGMAAYAAPLPGETVPRPGTAFWFPPLMRSPISGPADRATAFARALSRGGFPATVTGTAAERVPGAAGAAVLDTHVAALELSDWSLRALARDRALRRHAAAAAREAVAIASRRAGQPAPRVLTALLPAAGAVFARSAALPVPFDVEAFLRAHYTKVGDQTRHVLATYVALGDRLGLPSDALRELADALPS